MTTAADYEKMVADNMTGAATYTPDTSVTEANAHLAEVNAGKPTTYTSADADNLGNLRSQIINRDNYSYDPTKDATYQAYRQSYNNLMQQGAQQTQQAVNGLSGGYGSTWSGAAAGQQYGESLKAMNDILPSLEQNAYNAYTSEGDRLSNLYSLALNKESTDYSRYRDTVSDWKEDREYAATQADNAYSRDYQRYSDQLSSALTTEGWAREDATNDQSSAYNWAISLIQQGIMPNADILATAGISEEDALALAKKYGYKSGSGGSSRHKSGTGSGTGNGSGDSGSNNGNVQTPLGRI